MAQPSWGPRTAKQPLDLGSHEGKSLGWQEALEKIGLRADDRRVIDRAPDRDDGGNARENREKAEERNARRDQVKLCLLGPAIKSQGGGDQVGGSGQPCVSLAIQT